MLKLARGRGRPVKQLDASWIGIHERPSPSLKGRKGESSRQWSAGAGAAVTTAVLGVATYTLARLRSLLPAAQSSTDWANLPAAAGDALFFEAFVTGAAKGFDHAHDALIAGEAAKGLFDQTRPYRSAIDEPEVFSQLGAAPAGTD